MSEGNFICFGIEGVPFSKVQIELPTDGTVLNLDGYIALAKNVQTAYFAAFYPAYVDFPEDDPRRQQAPVTVYHAGNVAPLPEDEYAPSEPVRVPLDSHGNEAPRRTTGKGSGLFCPEHINVEVVLSKDEYQPKDDDGRIMRDKFYCPANLNGTGKNHNVWRSAAKVPVGA